MILTVPQLDRYILDLIKIPLTTGDKYAYSYLQLLITMQ